MRHLFACLVKEQDGWNSEDVITVQQIRIGVWCHFRNHNASFRSKSHSVRHHRTAVAAVVRLARVCNENDGRGRFHGGGSTVLAYSALHQKGADHQQSNQNHSRPAHSHWQLPPEHPHEEPVVAGTCSGSGARSWTYSVPSLRLRSARANSRPRYAAWSRRETRRRVMAAWYNAPAVRPSNTAFSTP